MYLSDYPRADVAKALALLIDREDAAGPIRDDHGGLACAITGPKLVFQIKI